MATSERKTPAESRKTRLAKTAIHAAYSDLLDPLANETSCPLCTAGPLEDLKRHLRETHGISRPPMTHFECGLCFARFKTEALLKDHLGSHTVELTEFMLPPTLHCSTDDRCGFSTRFPDVMEWHESTVHRTMETFEAYLEEMKNYCVNCKKEFQYDELAVHNETCVGPQGE